MARATRPDMTPKGLISENHFRIDGISPAGECRTIFLGLGAVSMPVGVNDSDACGHGVAAHVRRADRLTRIR